MVIGCGSQLALKIFRDVFEKDMIAVSEGLKEHIDLENGIFLRNPFASGFIVFTDENGAEQFFSAMLKSGLVICCNMTPEQKFVRIASEYGYAASASIDNPDDLMNKITKAYNMTGFRYIEVLAPCPSIWGHDSSTTVHMAAAATESGAWPLFEIENKKVKLGPRPAKLGVLESFNSLQSMKQFEQSSVEANWKELVQASLK
ncbi:MAG: hypothetical protein HZB65_03720 [Candidatus Aenigmarchaeota archaeon]|nr:hypothetical protein [Candidatus Aenigmarchaeota archaeon]